MKATDYLLDWSPRTEPGHEGVWTAETETHLFVLECYETADGDRIWYLGWMILASRERHGVNFGQGGRRKAMDKAEEIARSATTVVQS